MGLFSRGVWALHFATISKILRCPHILPNSFNVNELGRFLIFGTHFAYTVEKIVPSISIAKRQNMIRLKIGPVLPGVIQTTGVYANIDHINAMKTGTYLPPPPPPPILRESVRELTKELTVCPVKLSASPDSLCMIGKCPLALRVGFILSIGNPFGSGDA